MLLIRSPLLRALFALAVGLAVSAVCLSGWWAFSYLWPVHGVKQAVRAQLGDAQVVSFDDVMVDRATGTGCGVVNARSTAEAVPQRRHFILMADGQLQFEPTPDPSVQDPALQAASLERLTRYTALVRAHCFR